MNHAICRGSLGMSEDVAGIESAATNRQAEISAIHTVPLPFDRAASRYDETRGGEGRGRALAASLHDHLAGSDCLPGRAIAVDIGVGTATVAAGLTERGWTVVGTDISGAMLDVARHRLPGLLIQADARQLPIRTASVDAVYGVWVLHVSGNPSRVVAEACRVLRHGGRFVYVPSRPEQAASDIDGLLGELGSALRGGRPRVDAINAVRDMATAAGLIEIGRTTVSVGENPLSPVVARRQLIDRTWSPLWTLSEEEWQRHVRPVINALASLPDQEKPRTGRDKYDAIIFSKLTVHDQ